MEMVEDNANDGYVANDHLLFEDIGTGKAVVFKDGKRINGTWEKDTRTSRTIVRDTSGNEIKFDRGLIWFEILPTDGVLNCKISQYNIKEFVRRLISLDTSFSLRKKSNLCFQI